MGRPLMDPFSQTPTLAQLTWQHVAVYLIDALQTVLLLWIATKMRHNGSGGSR